MPAKKHFGKNAFQTRQPAPDAYVKAVPFPMDPTTYRSYRDLPPLAGLASFAEAMQPGLSIDDCVARLKRQHWALRRLHEIFIKRLTAEPIYELKMAFSLHAHYCAEHAAAWRTRVGEMREPPLGLDAVPHPALDVFFDEIRAAFLQKITEAYARNPKLANLLLDAYFNKTIQKAQANWRKVISLAVENGISVPTFASALSYYDAYRSARLPANLLQAQRDYFGAHTYERTDKPRGKFFHIDWPEANRPQIEA